MLKKIDGANKLALTVLAAASITAAAWVAPAPLLNQAPRKTAWNELGSVDDYLQRASRGWVGSPPARGRSGQTGRERVAGQE